MKQYISIFIKAFSRFGKQHENLSAMITGIVLAIILAAIAQLIVRGKIDFFSV